MKTGTRAVNILSVCVINRTLYNMTISGSQCRTLCRIKQFATKRITTANLTDLFARRRFGCCGNVGAAAFLERITATSILEMASEYENGD